jgi:DNA-binding CsgD family transcriptional regulator/tetratricopeptide (TPR) repeat protein
MLLLERETHLEELASLFDSARQESGCIALVYGEAGIGKTSLVRHFTSSQLPEGRVLWGECDSLFAPRPLEPLYDIARQIGSPILAQLEEGSDWLAIARTLLVNLEHHPAIVVIDDIHWADSATLDLIKYLGRRIQQTHTLLIYTMRDDELHPHHPLHIVFGDLASSGILNRIPISGLSAEAVGKLAIGKSVDPKALHHQTNGNPFFVSEVLAAGIDGIPLTVREAVMARNARLSLSAQAVLQSAAIIGNRIEAWLLDEVIGAETGALDECLSVGMLLKQGELLVFRHEISRRVVLDTISPTQTIGIHRQVLRALERSPITYQNHSRLAHHAEGANDVFHVLKYAPMAARQASSANAHREASDQYKRALRYADGLTVKEKAILLEAYASECAIIDDVEAAIQGWKEAIKIWYELGEKEKQSKILSELARILVRNGQNNEAEQASRTSIELLSRTSPSVELAKAYESQAALRMLNRDNSEAIAWGHKAIKLAKEFLDPKILANAYNVVGSAMLVSGNKDGCAYLEKSLRLAEQKGLANEIALAYTNLGSGSGEMYDFPTAMHYLQEGIDFCKEYEYYNHLHYLRAWQALSLFYQGKWTEAAEIAAEVNNKTQVANISKITALITLGRVRARRGDPGVVETLDEALELALQTKTLQRLAPVCTARAEAAWLSGDNDRVQQEIEDVYHLAIQKKHIWFSGEMAFWRWKVGIPELPPPWIAKPFLYQIKGNWKEAADEWQRLGCPYEHARALADGDEPAQFKGLEIFESQGGTPDAVMLREKLRTAGVSGIPRGPILSTQKNPYGLTTRQLEVLELLVKGSSNIGIAEKLSISPRTVEHHVTAILTKLNVNNRHEVIATAWQSNLFSEKRGNLP